MLGGLVLVTSTVAWAQPLPQAPANSEIAIRVLPSQYDLELDSEILKEQPLVRLFLKWSAEQVGETTLAAMEGAFEGTAVGAVLPDPEDGSSSLLDFFREDELRGQREALVDDLRSLAADLEVYKETNGSYPEDFRLYIDEERYYEPYMPDGVSYAYRRLEGGQAFRLEVSYQAPSRLGELGPAPLFTSGSVEEYAEPSIPREALQYVLALKIKDSGKVQSLADTLFGPAVGGFWSWGPGEPIATRRGQWLVLTNDKRHLGPFFKTLNGQAPGLSKTPGYALVARNVDMDASVSAYVDLPRLLWGVELPSGSDERVLLDLLGPVGYSIEPLERSQVRTEVFMGLAPPVGSDLQKVLAESGRSRTDSAVVIGNIPWDVSNAVALDYQASKRLLNALVALSPEAQQSMQMAEDVWAGFLGLDAEAGFDRLVEGWAVISFERLDIFVNAFEGFTEAMTSVGLPDELEGVGGPPDDAVEDPATGEDPTTGEEGSLWFPDSADAEQPSEDASLEGSSPQDGEPATDAPPEESQSSSEEEVETEPSLSDQVELEPVDGEMPPAPKHPPRVPFTVAFQVSDAQAQSVLGQALQKQLGEQVKHTDVYGVDVVGREDGLLSYAQKDNWYYISGGNTQRLLRNLLAAATGRKRSLTSLDTWTRFRTGQRGEVIAIGHQKVDATYSLVKSFLLFMGPDFRSLAYEVGGLRDYHHAIMLVPDGVLAVGEILQGEQK